VSCPSQQIGGKDPAGRVIEDDVHRLATNRYLTGGHTPNQIDNAHRIAPGASHECPPPARINRDAFWLQSRRDLSHQPIRLHRRNTDPTSSTRTGLGSAYRLAANALNTHARSLPCKPRRSVAPPRAR
jgi:hypothetical protein